MDKSTWQDDVSLKQKYPSLKEDLYVDVLIIGAGITGITSAYLLSEEGVKAALIEAGVIGRDSATSYTTAMLSYETDTDLITLAETFGTKNAKLAWEAGLTAIDFVEDTVRKEKINCEFTRCPGYSFTMSDNDLEEMAEEVEFAQELGFDVEFGEKSLGFTTSGYEIFSDLAKLHPLKYIEKLADIASRRKVKIFEKTEALKINEMADRVIVETNNGVIYAKDVIVATYSPFTHPLSMYFKAGKYTTYVIEAQIAKGKLKEGIYEDWHSPYHYFRIDPSTSSGQAPSTSSGQAPSTGSGQAPKDKYDRIIVGGEDHREDIPVSATKSFAALEEFLDKVVGEYKIVKKWTGPILEPIDGLPYVGRLKKDSHQYITHGFSGTGITFGTLSAMIFSDLILNRKNKFANLLDPTRFPTLKQLFAKGRDYSEELFGGAIKNTLS